MDYRVWIKNDDWRKIDNNVLEDIDRAVEYGIKYNIHVKINFHRAPGYTVANPKEKKPVWTDDEALDVCAMHWNHFAKRYAGISSRYLSFNLFNEPSDIKIEPFMKVHRRLCEAIRAEDPDRLIICDGMKWGTVPVLELLELKTAQATRGYMPMEISHYHASWVGDSLKNMKELPAWPLIGANGMLFAPGKQGINKNSQKSIRFTLPGNCGKINFKMTVGIVSNRLDLTAVALDENEKEISILMKKEFISGPGDGEWSKVNYKKEWNCYQNYFGREYQIEIPANAKFFELRAGKGDWMAFEKFSLQSEKAQKEISVPATARWDEPSLTMNYLVDDAGNARLTGGSCQDKKWHYDNYILPWKKWQESGGGMMVGEFGAYKYTPHEVVLAWMEDLLSNWKEAGWGWALWNFRGEIGCIDSNRADVVYEDFHGHKIDRKMVELLQKY